MDDRNAPFGRSVRGESQVGLVMEGAVDDFVIDDDLRVLFFVLLLLIL